MEKDELLEILACPQCKGGLEKRDEPEAFVCAGCRLAYPVRDGIPVMLVDEAERLGGEDGEEA